MFDTDLSKSGAGCSILVPALLHEQDVLRIAGKGACARQVLKRWHLRPLSSLCHQSDNLSYQHNTSGPQPLTIDHRTASTHTVNCSCTLFGWQSRCWHRCHKPASLLQHKDDNTLHYREYFSVQGIIQSSRGRHYRAAEANTDRRHSSIVHPRRAKAHGVKLHGWGRKRASEANTRQASTCQGPHSCQGICQVKNSHMITPKLYTSLLKVYPRPDKISGASQRGLLAAMLLKMADSSMTRDRLKSHP